MKHKEHKILCSECFKEKSFKWNNSYSEPFRLQSYIKVSSELDFCHPFKMHEEGTFMCLNVYAYNDKNKKYEELLWAISIYGVTVHGFKKYCDYEEAIKCYLFLSSKDIITKKDIIDLGLEEGV